MAAIVEASNKFALEMHKTLRAQEKFSGENLFYSPSSLSIALAMTFAGAGGNTAAEMAKVFHWDKLANVHGEMHTFLQALEAVNGTNVELSTANRLFLQSDFAVNESFVDEMTNSYEADVPRVDYKNDADGVRVQVNKWVEQKTKDKIKNLIAPGVFTSRTRLALVNAIYFKGAWLTKFKKENTKPGSFFVAPDQEVKVQMMNTKTKFKYHEDGDLQCQMIELPYDGQDLSMVLLLPFDQDGLPRLEASLTYDKLQQAVDCLAEAHPQKLDVFIPKFKLTQQFQLKEILRQMGVHDMFDEFKSDFTGIVPLAVTRLYVSHVIHKAFVEVNEEGTEAAAATAVAVMSRMMTMAFRADHPFLFLIRHNKTGAVVFLGSLVNPGSSAK